MVQWNLPFAVGMIFGAVLAVTFAFLLGIPVLRLKGHYFAIAIIGGLDNPLGVIVGGLVLGIIESLAVLYIGATFADVASFGVLVLVLIIRPSGLLGRTA
jgi:branched-subunit amino acid ABC-type transport system permease component